MKNPFKPELSTAPDHVHNWEVITKTYAPPRKEFNSAVPELAEKALFGVTTILSECTACHEHIKEELLGTDEDKLEELMDKAETFGPQYINRGTDIFVVGKYIPPAADPMNLPLR